jgi:alpha-tubulin suppressor-like RCC1 family protein
MKVIEVSAGRHHVLVLTDMDGVFAFGQGSNGQLGLGDAEDHYTPAKITSLDGLNVIQVSAGGDHSIAVTGETHSNRQIFSWGLGKNG